MAMNSYETTIIINFFFIEGEWNWKTKADCKHQIAIFAWRKKKKLLKKIFADCGEKVSYFPKILPLYPKLIKFHNNIVIASNVNFITHDAIHVVLNNIPGLEGYTEAVGCIEIMDNVFIGANSTILYGTKIHCRS